ETWVGPRAAAPLAEPARAPALRLARSAARLVDDPLVRRREPLVAEERSGLGRRQVERCRPGPLAQQLLAALDGQRDPRHDGEAVPRIADRVLDYVLEPQRAELLEQPQPAGERTRHARRQHAGPRNQLVAALAEAFDRRSRGRA